KSGGIQALVWDFTITHPGTNVINQVYYKRDLPSLPKNKVTLNLANVPEGKYALEIYKVGYRVNDAYATYLDLGSPAQLTRAQVAKIKSENSGAPIARSTVKVARDGKVQQRFDLRENDVCLFVLKKL
ncbi:MAG: glycoside hydrolase, partial [Limisphaerales bacterium]